MSIKAEPTPSVPKKTEKEELTVHKHPDYHKPQAHMKKDILLANRARPNVGPLPSILHEAGYKTDIPNNGFMAGRFLPSLIVLVQLLNIIFPVS